jgi:hypothetical protein
MKKITLMVVLMTLAVAGLSQDSLYFRNGMVYPVTVHELTPRLIKYKYHGAESYFMQSAKLTDVWKIRYASGFVRYPSGNSGTPPADFIVQEKTSYAGPRIGITFVGPGQISDQLAEMNKSPILSQFGWQFETRFFKTNRGVSGLFEFVPMIAGMEQGVFLPSASLLIGMRVESGDCVEVALGPNLSMSGLGMVFAAGTSFHVGEVYFPVNLAVVPSVGRMRTEPGTTIKTPVETGLRITLTIGFNIRKT